MSSRTTPTIFVIGGTGAQGMPVVRALVADKKYSVRVLSRDSTSPRGSSRRSRRCLSRQHKRDDSSWRYWAPFTSGGGFAPSRVTA